MDLALVSVAWFGTPMFDSRATVLGLPPAVFLMLVGAGLTAVGFAWIRHLLRPDELMRGEARWRYRDRGGVDRLDEALLDVQAPRRTPGWWATRMEFGIAIAFLATPAILIVWPTSTMSGGHGLSTPGLLFLGIGYAGMLFGLGWMIRIYRAPAEGARGARWRFRDHA